MLNEVDSFSVMFTRMKQLQEASLFTDVTFFLQGGAKIKAHKCVLAACSSVFSNMFQSSFIEGRTSQIKLKDVNGSVFTAFLNYVYVRDVSVVEKHVKELMDLADKYDVQDLLLVCDGLLEKSLNPANAVDFMLLADLHRRDDLKIKIGNYIKINLDTITTHRSWEKLENHIDVLSGLVHSFVLPDDTNMCSKRSNSITWTLRDGYDWYKKSEVTPWETLKLIDGNPNIVFHVTLTGSLKPNYYQIAVRIKSQNNISPDYSTFVTVSKRSLSGEDAVTKIQLKWPLNESDATILVPWDDQKDQFYSLEYPVFITVAVQPLNASDRYKLIEEVVDRNPKFSDAEIIINNDKSIEIHKLVLANRSRFFSNLLTEEVCVYRIDDIDENTLTRLLDYMYSLSNPSSQNVNLNLLKGAVQFQLDQLVDYCVSTLCNNINHSNAVDICTAGEELGLETLVSSALDFIKRCPLPSVMSAQWLKMKNHPRLVKELLFKIKEATQTSNS